MDGVLEIMRIAKREAGINLGEAKRPLVEARLAKRVRELGVDLAAYARRCADDADERVTMLDLLTTNHTSWWREPAHFVDLAERVLPAVVAARSGAERPRLRIWCAAAATGEEPYTLAMIARATLPDPARWDAAVLATDISGRALARARAGAYVADRAAALPDVYRTAGLTRAGASATVRDEVRKLVSFARLNLMEPWPMRGPFDCIFCRNVMIYFDDPTRAALVRRLAGLLEPGGTLYVGQSESLGRIDAPLRYHAPAVYVRT